MKKLFLRLCVPTLALALTSPIVRAQPTPSAAAGAGESLPSSPLPDDVLNPLVGEPQRHFDQASALFTRGDNAGSAAEIRAAAALLRLESRREGSVHSGQLTASATNLDQLASHVVAGDVNSRRQLDLAFARADLALAGHYRELADRALAHQEHASAGRWLKAASDYVDDASHWSGQQPPTAQAQAEDQIHALEAKIRSGANWSASEAKRGVGYLGTQIQYLGSQMQQFGAQPSSTP
jgi:hypothetical protein